MLWMLEKDPRLQKVVLCLDHDAAGIEATGRLTDILVEHGYTQVSVQRPDYKDWDEDLKALHGLPAQPAEEHPQLLAAGKVCRRIGAQCRGAKPERAAEQLPDLLDKFRNLLQRGRSEEAGDCLEAMAALALATTLRECRQLGTTLTPEQGAQYLQSQIQPHRNRGSLNSRAAKLSDQIRHAVSLSGAPGVRAEAQKRDIAAAWLELALSCARAAVKQAADQPRQTHTQEKIETSMELTM